MEPLAPIRIYDSGIYLSIYLWTHVSGCGGGAWSDHNVDTVVWGVIINKN